MGEPSLRHSTNFTNLVDQLEGVALWTVTEPGEFEYISAGFEKIWGVPREEIIDNPERLLETIHPDDRDRVRANTELSGQELRETSYEGRVVQPDGSVRWVLTQQVPLRDADGDVSEVVGICTDITEQKRREEELEVLNRIIRHDIRNDIAIILGWGELLEEHVDDRGDEYLEKILASGEHIIELTELTRDYVDVVTSARDITIESVPLRSTLETEISLREESYPHAEFIVEDEIPDVPVAANKLLNSVFKNLLNNAVQHNDKETPTVEIFCETNADEIVLKISDNGPGIADQHKEVIFGKGEKGLGSPGTGIGLYLVETLVDQYGGDIWVEDNDPTGAVFAVKLRRAD